MSGFLSLAATGVQALGQIQQGKAEKRAAEFDALVREQQAGAERDAAGAEAEDFRSRESRKRSASIARLGASGAGVTGSPLLVDEAFVRDVALGSARIIQGGEVRAQRQEQQATLSRFQGRNAKRAANLRAGGTLLSGIGTFAGQQGF